MSNNFWTAKTGWQEVCRRVGGRRHYNAVRTLRKEERRRLVMRLLDDHHLTERGTISAIAAKLGVAVCTVSRDVKAILRGGHPCPHCGALPKCWREADEVDALLDEHRRAPAGGIGNGGS